MYDEALQLSRNSYGTPYLEKVQNGHFNHLILTGQMDLAKSLMTSYLGTDRDKWMHWLTKIMI